jgi:hypothetical protein
MLNINGMSYREASNYIAQSLSEDRAFASSLIMCLDRKSQKQAQWKINLEAIGNCREDLYGFEKYGEFDMGPVLMMVGEKSFQFEIENDVKFYNNVFPHISSDDIIIVKEAGHWLHYEK